MRTFQKETAYSWWKAMLGEGKLPTIHADDPQPGFYRKREVRGGPWFPVAYWVGWDSGKLHCAVKHGLEEFKFVDPDKTWTRCADNAVGEADFRFYAGYGEGNEPPPGLS